MSNHHQILSDTFYKAFEIPLLENLDLYKSAVVERETTYEKSLAETSRRIKETEAENMRIGKKKQRDLNSFRRALADLTSQVEQLDRLKSDYYREVLDTERANLGYLLQMASVVVRAEIDIYERVASKGIADPVLEPMMTNAMDPFSTFATRDEREIFSILPPLTMTSAASVHSGKDPLKNIHKGDVIPEDDEEEDTVNNASPPQTDVDQ